MTRLPFVFNGYGTDAVGWRIVQSGYTLFTEGKYQPSRLPGYPLPEYSSSLIWISNLPSLYPWIFNLVTALFSVFAVYYFLMIFKKLFNDTRYRYTGYCAAIAFALTPAFYVNSTNMMDFVWALFFVMGSINYALSKKYTLSALFLVLATGSRITSGILLFPICYFLVKRTENISRRKALHRYLIFYFLFTSILFLPLISNYGIDFLSFDPPVIYPSIVNLAGKASIRIWGIIGSFGLMLSLFFTFLILKQDKITRAKFKTDSFVWFLITSITLYFILFIFLPLESGYLIPVIPLTILLFYKVLAKKYFMILCISLIISPFIINVDADKITVNGPLITDFNKRESELHYIDEVIDKIKTIRSKSIIVCESYLPKIELMIQFKEQRFSNFIRLIYSLFYDSIKTYAEVKNINIFYLKNVRDQTLKVYNYDIETLGGKEL